eukprot:COSAG02_NODE_2695_length_8214_cov_12.071842_5_plen_55_part_00
MALTAESVDCWFDCGMSGRGWGRALLAAGAVGAAGAYAVLREEGDRKRDIEVRG